MTPRQQRTRRGDKRVTVRCPKCAAREEITEADVGYVSCGACLFDRTEIVKLVRVGAGAVQS